MPRRLRLRLHARPAARLVACLLAVVASAAACKQGEGEYCQITADCEDGLVCAPLTDTCERTVGPAVDAGPDATPIDAAIDGPPIDAELEPDAMPDAEEKDPA